MSDRRRVLELFEKYDDITSDMVKSGIELNRKGAFEICVKDKDGNRLENVKLDVKQKTHAFKFGANLFMLDELETPEKNEIYKERFAELFNMATLPFYWDATEPERGHTRYTKDSEKIYRRPPIDLCIEYCEKHGIEPREHALAYEHFFPDWLRDAPVYEIKSALENRYREISERYKDKIPTIEVTNEMEWERGKTAFYDEPDYVDFCFKLAEKYFPSNELVINEWSGMWNSFARPYDRYSLCIENALLKGARIDAIGLQYHMFHRREDEYDRTRSSYDPLALMRVLDRYSSFGKPLQISEVTIPAYSNDPEDEALQAEILKRLYSLWFSHSNVEQIIYWNLVDGYAAFAPQGDMSAGENYYHGGLLRFDMTPKPAFYTLKELFTKEWHTDATLVTSNGSAVSKGFYGVYSVVAQADGKMVECDFEIRPGRENKLELVLE